MGGSAEAAVLAERVLPYHSLCLAGLRGLLVFMHALCECLLFLILQALPWHGGGGPQVTCKALRWVTSWRVR